MRMLPGLPHDPMQAEFENDQKDFAGWHRFFAREIPFRERMADFCRWLIYFAQADLVFIDEGLMEKPEAAVLFSLEYVAERLDRDGDLLATMWLLFEAGELGSREARWSAQHRILVSFGRMGAEGSHGHS